MKRQWNLRALWFLTLLVLSLVMLPGCGGEAETTAPSATGAGVNGSIIGTAVKGPVNGGTVTAYAINNGAMGGQLGSAMTDTLGNFSMGIGDYAGPLMLSMSGGSYMDEATGSMTTMAAGDVMTCVIPSMSRGAAMTGLQMTPLTSMAQTMASGMAGGMTQANISTANMAMGSYFMAGDILFTPPMNPNVSGSGAGATQDMRNYGMAIAAMSEYAKTVGMTSSSGMVTAMMNDASDGFMNGMMAGGSVMMGGGMMGGNMMHASAGTAGMADAMTSFMNSAMNRSGLTVSDMQALIDHMNSSSGAIK